MSLKYSYVTKHEDLAAIAREVERADVIGLDIETTSYEPYDIKEDGKEARIRLLQLNTGFGIYVVDLFQTGGLGPLREALANESTVKIVQNAKFEQKWFLYKHDLELWPLFDTYRASAILYNGIDMDHDLWTILERELDVTPQAVDLGGSNWSAPILTQQQKDYAAEDVQFLMELRDVLKPKLAEKGLNTTALVEFGAILPEAAVELNGIYLDAEKWSALAAENAQRTEEIRNNLIWKLPNPKEQFGLPGIMPATNLDSTDQVLASLRRMGGRLATLPDTKEITMAMYAAEFDIIEEILEYRGFSKKVTQFGEKYLQNIHPATGRIHASYFPFTGAGRYACSNPNLQQIPRLKAFRACFTAPEGRRMVVADYSNIEMRLMAQITRDPGLIEIFCSDDPDAHRATAALLAGCAREEVTKEQRQEAKAVNFGLIYGMQAAKLVLYAMANYGVTMTLQTAKAYREKYFEGYANVALWHQYQLNEVRPSGIVRTLSGRLRHLGEDTWNEWLNTPSQGSGADGLKAALREVYFRMKKTFGSWNGPVKMVHHVHDEIILDTEDNDEVDYLARRELCEGMREGMEKFVNVVPVDVEPESGDSWGTAKA